jgi:hypothetical protein
LLQRVGQLNPSTDAHAQTIMNTTLLHRAATGLLVGATLAASASAWADSSPLPANKKSTAAAPPSAGAWVTARQKHNASGMALRYQTPAAVKLGQRGQVALTIAGVTAPEGAQVEIKGSDPAMTILLNGNPVNAPITLAGGQSRRMDLEVANAPEGLQYVNVFMTQEGRSSVVAIPIKVGHGQLTQKAQGEVQTTLSGEKVIVLPAGK